MNQSIFRFKINYLRNVLFYIFIVCIFQWVTPENIYTHTMGGILEFRGKGGGSWDLNSEGIEE